ncbi:hypothetical protein INR49_012677 [Caranx melampygus]|nr:hypothetical protein INR49_012677 [Caranx melampygus]
MSERREEEERGLSFNDGWRLMKAPPAPITYMDRKVMKSFIKNNIQLMRATALLEDAAPVSHCTPACTHTEKLLSAEQQRQLQQQQQQQQQQQFHSIFI